MIDKSIKGKAFPRILFYEREDKVKELLHEQTETSILTKAKDWYYTPINLKNNSFWTYSALKEQKTKETQNCLMQ